MSWHVRKNTKITVSIGTVAIFLIVIVFVFSSDSLEKKIIGTWQINEQPQIFVTFGENNTFSMSDGEDYLEGNYTFIDDSTLQVHMNYLWADFMISGQISIKGDKMTISSIDDPDDVFGANGATLTLDKTK